METIGAFQVSFLWVSKELGFLGRDAWWTIMQSAGVEMPTSVERIILSKYCFKILSASVDSKCMCMCASAQYELSILRPSLQIHRRPSLWVLPRVSVAWHQLTQLSHCRCWLPNLHTRSRERHQRRWLQLAIALGASSGTRPQASRICSA